MGSLRFSRRDIIVLVSIFWSLVLIYCGYLLVLKVQDMRREAIIEANRTRNDIVIDNAERIFIALCEYRSENDQLPDTLEVLVDSGFLKTIPVNPFTGKPLELVRLNELPNIGNVTLISSWVESGKADRSEVSQSEHMLLVSYGDPNLDYVKYANRIIRTWNSCNFVLAPTLPEELDSSVIYLNGGLGSPGGESNLWVLY